MPERISSADAKPRVSVVMPVHNALPHLDEAVESILGQTYTDFEFVILDDASTDGSRERLHHWAQQDSRIRLLEVASNLGPALSSERVARAAAGSIVARMDADDISYPQRLSEQLDLLDSHPEVGVVGGLYDIIDAQGRVLRTAEPWRLAHHSVFPPFGNGPLMYRREVFEAIGGYREECVFWEDQDLLIRMSTITRLMVIPRAIYKVRQSQTSTRFASEQTKVEQAVDLMYRCRGRLEEGRSYDDLLAGRPTQDAKLDPRVFIALGSVVLWAGHRPRLFRRLLKRGDLKLNFRTVSSIIWTAWASFNPWSLRQFMRMLLLGRNLYARTKVHFDHPVYWSLPSKAAVCVPKRKSAI